MKVSKRKRPTEVKDAGLDKKKEEKKKAKAEEEAKQEEEKKAKEETDKTTKELHILTVWYSFNITVRSVNNLTVTIYPSPVGYFDQNNQLLKIIQNNPQATK